MTANGDQLEAADVTRSLSVPRGEPARLADLRTGLIASGYTEARVGGPGAAGDPWSLTGDLPTRDGSAFSVLFALFAAGTPVDTREAEAALAPLRLQDLEAVGLVERRADRVHPRFLIRPHGDLFVASDLPTRRADCVLGMVPASETLAHLTVRRPVVRALDLGTGCGAQALLLARHSAQVVAIDINPRALAFARFNAGLNEISNIEWREGSWFAPVTGERFDVIACNPPYVISPDAAYTYRDAALPRDRVCRTVVGEAARHLEEGAFATVLCNWIDDGAGATSLRAWVEDTGCDALLLHYGTVEAATYAARWNGDLLGEPRRFERTVRRWLDYYRAEGIDGIALGAVILRRRSRGRGWVRALDMAAGPTGAASDHLLRLFEAADFLAEHDGNLLDHAFRFVEGHRVDQTLQYDAGGYAVGPAIYRCLPGIGIEARIDARVLDVLLECDGQRTLRQLVAGAAARRGESPASLTKLIAETSRQLIERGFMVPRGGTKGENPC